jgi:hypothetical protein
MNQVKNHWARMAELHWKKFLPKMYRKLQEAGTLEQELIKAGNQASEAIAALGSDGGLRREEAVEIVLPQYILLPPESPDQEPSETDTRTTGETIM